MKEELELFNRISHALLKAEKHEPVVSPIPADKVYAQLDLHLEEDPLDEQQFAESLKELILNTPRTATDQFFNQLFGGRKSKATLGDLLAVMMNNSMYTYKVGGPMIAIEREIIRNIMRMAGYPDDASGTIATGGSMTNYMAMIMARDKFDPNIRFDGVTHPMVMYSSEESHYSIKKNASFGGIGRSNIRFIKTDEKARMIPEELETQIIKDKEAGLYPFFINATVGTTVMGAVDPVRDIAEIAAKHNIWLHADAAFYGSFLFSEKYHHLTDGLELTDSFSVNAHKMFSTPLTCSMILTRHKKCLYDSFNSNADYLFQENKDDWNPGKISFQCGRRNDALKFWCLWKAEGTSGLRKIVDHEMYLADAARTYIRDHADYTLHSFDESLTVCFTYKNISPAEICQALYEEAEIMVGYGKFRGKSFIRFVTVNSNNSKEDIIDFFKRFERFVDSRF